MAVSAQMPVNCTPGLKLNPNVPTIGVPRYHIAAFFPNKSPMKRIFLFVLTNIAVLALLSLVLFVVENVFGVHLMQGGTGGLLVFAAIFGFGGSLISLALSKWTAKRMMGVRVIERPQSQLERWLVGTVKGLATQT